jgi:hypothetical protein
LTDALVARVRLHGFRVGSSRRVRGREAAPLLLDQSTMDEARRRRADRDLAAHIQSATQSLREERDRLAKRLADLERELANLAARHDAPSAYVTAGDSGRRRS